MDLSNAIFLAQSDTTAGFLSANPLRILNAKNSPKNKAILRESCDLSHIKAISRIPSVLQKRIRRAKKTTFIFDNNLSFRVISPSNSSLTRPSRELEKFSFDRLQVLSHLNFSVQPTNLTQDTRIASDSYKNVKYANSQNLHHAFLKRFGILFSSSANKNGKRFDLNFALEKADIIVCDSRGIYEDSPSRIFKVQKSKLKRIR